MTNENKSHYNGIKPMLDPKQVELKISFQKSSESTPDLREILLNSVKYQASGHDRVLDN
jgi:hypothetical protein